MGWDGLSSILHLLQKGWKTPHLGDGWLWVWISWKNTEPFIPLGLGAEGLGVALTTTLSSLPGGGLVLCSGAGLPCALPP